MSGFYFLYFEQDYWKKQARSDIVTAEQIQKKEWLQRYLHETQKLKAMQACKQYTETECSIAEQAVEETKCEIKQCIAAVENPELEAVLIRRYVNFQTWEQIADEMHYSLRTIRRRHNDAIDNVVTHWH